MLPLKLNNPTRWMSVFGIENYSAWNHLNAFYQDMLQSGFSVVEVNTRICH